MTRASPVSNAVCDLPARTRAVRLLSDSVNRNQFPLSFARQIPYSIITDTPFVLQTHPRTDSLYAKFRRYISMLLTVAMFAV